MPGRFKERGREADVEGKNGEIEGCMVRETITW